MGILSRVEEIRAVEHQKLRTALMRVEEAMGVLEEELAALNAAKPRKVDMFGEAIYVPTEPQPTRRVDIGPLKRSFGQLEDTILDRLNMWEETLWPLVRNWVNGIEVATEIQQIAADLLSARNEIDRHLTELRKHAWFVEELTEPMHVLFAAIEMCDRAEQDEVIPALLSGSLETADHTERSLSGDDITRNLRAAMRTPETAPQRTDPIGRFLSWMGGRGS